MVLKQLDLIMVEKFNNYENLFESFQCIKDNNASINLSKTPNDTGDVSLFHTPTTSQAPILLDVPAIIRKPNDP